MEHLARVRHRQRPRYGFYVDHLLDATGTFFLMSGLALSSYMNATVAYAFLIVYLLLSIEIYLATHALGTFKLSFWNFGPDRTANSSDRRQSFCAKKSGCGDCGPFFSAF